MGTETQNRERKLPQKSTPPAAIFFDAVGTLLHPAPPAAEVYFDAGRRHGSSLDLDTIRHRFSQAFQEEEDQDRAEHFRTSEEREIQRWQNIVRRVLDDVHDVDECFRELYEHFAKPEAWRLETEADLVCTELVRQGYYLGLASNYDSRLRKVVAGIGPLQKMNHIVISSEVGWRKPASEFFTALCQAVRLPAERIFFVGDDPVNDFAGARAAGLQAILFDPKRKHAGKSENVIADLGSLAHLPIGYPTCPSAHGHPPS